MATINPDIFPHVAAGFAYDHHGRGDFERYPYVDIDLMQDTFVQVPSSETLDWPERIWCLIIGVIAPMPEVLII